MKQKTFSEKVWELTSKIPKGKVSTYREIAHALDSNCFRAVGQALKRNPYSPKVPCHRIVKSNGCIGGYFGSTEIKSLEVKKKISMLRKEGIKVKDGRIINFKKHFLGLRQ